MNKTVNKSILVAAAAALFSANSFAEVTRHALPNNNPVSYTHLTLPTTPYV